MVSRTTGVPSISTARSSTASGQLKLLPLKADISLPRRLARPPTAADLIIKKTFDGLTPAAAANQITTHFLGTIAPQNQNLVDTTVAARVRDMQVALNNVFTKGTPNRRFLENQLPASIAVIGSMSQSNAVVYKITRAGQEPKYFTKDWSGAFAPMAKPPIQVVMEGRINLDPPALRMTYPGWQNKALGGVITTITEG